MDTAKRRGTALPRRPNRYAQLIERVFAAHFREGETEVEFGREEFAPVARDLGIVLPKNLGDVLYSFRHRTELPESIRSSAPAGLEWTIVGAGRSRYKLVAVPISRIIPDPSIPETKIPDATPGVIARYALSDEQALLAKLRYNRLIDIFTGITCYSLQSHLRTTVRGLGQVETDEIYIGLDTRGVHYVLPVQAKGGSDKIGVVQINQDVAMCQAKFSVLVCRPIAAQFMREDLIALFELDTSTGDVKSISEQHYRLVAPDEVTSSDLAGYRSR